MERKGRSKSRGRSSERGTAGSKERRSTSSPAGGRGKKEKFHYEFGGPIGTTINMLALPFVVIFLYTACPSVSEGPCLPGVNVFALSKMWWPSASHLFTFEAFFVVTAWFFFIYALELALPKTIVLGVPLADGSRLPYRINSHLSFWVALFVVEHSPWGGNGLAWVYDNFVQLATAACVLSTFFSIGLYVASFRPGAKLAQGGRSGCVPYDMWMGRELNPRVGGWDLKFFCEMRPGLIGWAVLNLACAAKERELRGGNSLAMIVVCMFQGFYVWDGQYNESSVLTTLDVTTDGFGYMLCFGDLAWVPFTYATQARYLVEHSSGLSDFMVCVFTLIGVGGYYLFRAANYEKDAFRKDPSSPAVAHLKYMNTKRGTRLLVSGWWGMARKINYTGDWLMGLSWSLVTGFGSVVSYFFPIYFAILLVHRAWRDDEMCAKKYGDDWIKYKKKVPYVFIPGLL